jgi:hypothetical protein
MLYLIWSDYTRLAKQIAAAAIFGTSIDRSANWSPCRPISFLALRPLKTRLIFSNADLARRVIAR